MRAFHRVFNVFELGEAVLTLLPLYDLVLAVSVCQTFRHVVLNSNVVRMRLRNEPIPVFARFQPGDPLTEDLCNVNERTPWFFRTTVTRGIVIVLRTAEENIQLHIPDDPQKPAHFLDGRRTAVIAHSSIYLECMC